MSRLDRKELIKLWEEIESLCLSTMNHEKVLNSPQYSNHYITWEEEILPGLIKALNIMHSAARRGYHLELTTHEGDKYDIWEEPANA